MFPNPFHLLPPAFPYMYTWLVNSELGRIKHLFWQLAGPHAPYMLHSSSIMVTTTVDGGHRFPHFTDKEMCLSETTRHQTMRMIWFHVYKEGMALNCSVRSQERAYSGREVIGGGPRGDSGGLAMVRVLIWVVATQVSFGDNSLGYTLVFWACFCVSTKMFTKMRLWRVKWVFQLKVKMCGREYEFTHLFLRLGSKIYSLPWALLLPLNRVNEKKSSALIIGHAMAQKETF